jgi:hypothetical protein
MSETLLGIETLISMSIEGKIKKQMNLRSFND